MGEWGNCSLLCLCLGLYLSLGYRGNIKFAFVYLASNSSSGKSEKFLHCAQFVVVVVCAFGKMRENAEST